MTDDELSVKVLMYITAAARELGNAPLQEMEIRAFNSLTNVMRQAPHIVHSNPLQYEGFVAAVEMLRVAREFVQQINAINNRVASASGQVGATNHGESQATEKEEKATAGNSGSGETSQQEKSEGSGNEDRTISAKTETGGQPKQDNDQHSS